jgi:cytidine deaminase
MVKLFWSNQENAAYPQDFAQNALQFFMQVPFIQQQNFENGNHSSFGPTKLLPYSCGSCRQSIAEYEIKQETPIEIYFMGEMEIFINLIP